MNLDTKAKFSLWWGPPKKFSVEAHERKISWLELFYDLVYVIAIARVTHHLGEHFSVNSMIDYTYLFGMIYWGWLNGSWHHDLHGSTGLRTNLMTLWQMVIVAALIVTLGGGDLHNPHATTVALMCMQIFITYLWWSVGIYDKDHRALNVPYTVCYLLSFALLFSTLYIPLEWERPVKFASLLLNFMPFYVVVHLLRRNRSDFSLTSSMSERLGLFTIILFGEVVTGVISGMSELPHISISTWINFVLAILIVFSLWWIFFSTIADRPAQPGFRKGWLVTLLYMPVMMALGVTGVSFAGILSENESSDSMHSASMIGPYAFALCCFLCGVALLMQMLVYPEPYEKAKYHWQKLLAICAGVFFLLAISPIQISLTVILTGTLVILLFLIYVFTKVWMKQELQ